jgi:hypothetical protein
MLARAAAPRLELVAPTPRGAAALRDLQPSLAGDEDSLAMARVDLARRLRSRKAELQEVIFDHVRGAVPDGANDHDAQLAVGLRKVIAACVDCGLASIEQGARWSGPIPPVVAAQAGRGASSGVSLTTALCRCVAGHTLLWSFVFEEVVRHDLPDEQRFALLLQASAAMGEMLASVQAVLADAHSSEIVRRARSHEQRRAEIVDKLLADEPVDTGELAELGYELDGWHLGMIATGPQVGKAMRALAAGLRCDLLPVAHGSEMVWAWLGARRRVAFAEIERVFSAGEHLDLSLAIGEPGRGAEGWRQTHREAQGALLVARSRGGREQHTLTRYLHVATEATALRDDALADSLIETYLAPLERMRIGGQAARRTLRALFETGHNVTSASFILKVNRTTVHRQRTEIERRLDCRLHEHQAEIEVALRIEALRRRHDGDDDATGVASRAAKCNTLV